MFGKTRNTLKKNTGASIGASKHKAKINGWTHGAGVNGTNNITGMLNGAGVTNHEVQATGTLPV